MPATRNYPGHGQQQTIAAARAKARGRRQHVLREPPQELKQKLARRSARMARAEQVAELLQAIARAQAETSLTLVKRREQLRAGTVASDDAEARAVFEETYGLWRDACRKAVNNAGAFLAGPCPKNPVNLSEGVLRAINSVFALSAIAVDDYEAAITCHALDAVADLGLAEHLRTRGAAPVPYFIAGTNADTTADIADTTADVERPSHVLTILDTIVDAWLHANALSKLLENPHAEEYDNAENALRYWNNSSCEQLKKARQFLAHCDKADNKASCGTGNEVGNNANPVVKLVLRALVDVDDVCKAAGDVQCLAEGARTLNSVTELAAAVLKRLS